MYENTLTGCCGGRGAGEAPAVSPATEDEEEVEEVVEVVVVPEGGLEKMALPVVWELMVVVVEVDEEEEEGVGCAEEAAAWLLAAVVSWVSAWPPTPRQGDTPAILT